MTDFGGNYLNNEIYMYDIVDRDGVLNDSFNEPIHKS